MTSRDLPNGGLKDVAASVDVRNVRLNPPMAVVGLERRWFCRSGSYRRSPSELLVSPKHRGSRGPGYGWACSRGAVALAVELRSVIGVGKSQDLAFILYIHPRIYG